MNGLHLTKFQVTVDKQPKGLWSFGVCISRFHDEIYIFLNLFKISATNVKKGQYVYQGNKIGLVGSTGYSTGPHLHFTVYKNGKLVNPQKLLNNK